VVLLIFFSGIFVFCSQSKHLLVILLALEVIVLGVFLSMTIFFLSTPFLSLFYLVFTVCEGALGLSLLVNLRRSYGGDIYFFYRYS